MVPEQKIEYSNAPWVRVEQLDKTLTESAGLWRRGNDPIFVGWDEVIRVAVVYEIHPIAIADWDYWAFQTDDLRVTYWVDIGRDMDAEVRRRFPHTDPPPMGEWADREFDIRAYVVWPPQDVGKPLYSTVKRHWWSWKAALAYAPEFRATR